MIAIEKEHIEELNYWRELALEETDGTDREYQRQILFGWHVLDCPDEDVLLAELKTASEAENYRRVQQIFFTRNKKELSWFLSSGYDHCFLVYRVIPYLCCAVYDEIYRAFPDSLPLAANGHSMLVNATALLQCILYKGKYDVQKVISKAEKYVSSKQPKWYRAYVACFLAMLEENDVMFSDNLQILCDYHSRQDFSMFEKYKSQYAYGLLVFAKHNLPESVFRKVRLPEHKTFDQGYMKWLYDGQFVRRSIYDYKDPFEELNYVYEMPLPTTAVYQPYLDAENVQVSPQEKKAYHMDVEAMNDQILDYVINKKLKL